MALELPGPCNGELPELALPDPDECDEDVFQPAPKKRRGAAKAKSQVRAKGKAVPKPKGAAAPKPKGKAAPDAEGSNGKGPAKAKMNDGGHQPKTESGKDLLNRLMTEVGM